MSFGNAFNRLKVTIKPSANHGVSVRLWEVDDMEKNNSSEVYICL